MPAMWKSELLRAIDIAGGQTALAERLSGVMRRKIVQQHVHNWLKYAKKLPTDVCLPIQYATQGQVKASTFRPESYFPSIFDDMPLDQLIERIESSESPNARVGG